MSKSKINPLITASVMSAVCMAGVSQKTHAVVNSDNSVGNVQLSATTDSEVQNFRYPTANSQGLRRYIIQLKQASVSSYDGVGTLAAIPRRLDHKIEVNSPAVAQYVSALELQQASFLNQLTNSFSRNVVAEHSFKFAVNGMSLYLSAAEAKSVKDNALVKNIELDREYFLDTDAGPALIGADNVWAGNAPSTGTAHGEGVVIGVIDSGANFDHPSFADIGGDGYDHTNRLGAGNFLGVCDSTNTEQFDAAYTCNDKLIGGYDFVNDETPVDGFDVPGPEDANGHGTHTASTAGGNLVTTASVNGISNIEISGVARHANIVVYDACYTAASGQGLCPNVSTLSSIEQVIADGVVDVVNYSIGGGGAPWLEAVSQAFLAATDNGVFVSAAAGNSGPGAATLDHVEPWTSTVGASTHNRVFQGTLSVTPGFTDVPYTNGNGPAVIADISAEVRFSGDVDPANVDGCNPWAADQFLGEIALVDIFTCNFSVKVDNAAAAGALAVIVISNAEARFNMGGLTETTIPAMTVALSTGDAIAAAIAGGTLPGTIEQQERLLDGQVDVMAGFSSRGPSPFEVNKPDVTAPGVNILAAEADSTVAGSPDAEYGLKSGTSMSSPHNAGAAALLKELQPNWSVPEIKSALMMTGVTDGVTKEDAVTPADAFDRGAGRIQVDVASSVGLVMDESAFDFLAADPAGGGDPKELNLASYKNDDCEALCTFERTFRSVASDSVTYDAAVSGLTGSINPANFTVAPGQEVTLEVTIDGSASPIGETSFGELSIVPVADATLSFPLASQFIVVDNTYTTNDPIDNMSCSTISVSGVAAPLTMSAELAIDHTFMGDLTMKLFSPSGDELTLFSEVGDSTNFSSFATITFSDAGAIDAALMGNALAGGEAVCVDDGLCDYFANSDGEDSSVDDFATVAGVDPNGDWQLCGGDSAGGDEGVVRSGSLIFSGQSLSPELQLPLVIIGFPDQPIIGVSPGDVNEVLPMGGSTDVILNISNAGLVADLNWTIADTGTVDNFTLNQPVSPGPEELTGVLNAFGGGGVYPADTFTVGEGSLIESVSISGVSNGSGNLLADASDVTVAIFADAGGVPAGHPDDGAGSDVFSLTLPVGDPSLDLDGGSGFIGIDILAATGNGVELPAGQYWILVYPTVLNGNVFFWNQGEDASPGNVLRIDPTDLLGGGTGWQELTDVAALNVLISNELTCDADWLTALVTLDATDPGADIDVTVSLDAADLEEGVYRSAVCIVNDDFDNALVSIPVTLTVGPSDLIFENGFEAIAP